MVSILCDTCNGNILSNENASGTYISYPCNAVSVTNPNTPPPPFVVEPICGNQIEGDGAVSFWVNYLHSLWVEVLKPQSIGQTQDGVYVGVRMDGGTGGVALPLALPSASGGVGGTWRLDVLGDVTDLEAITVFHINLVTIGGQPRAGLPPIGTTGGGGTYQQLALYTPATSPTLVSAGSTPTTALYYTTNSTTNISTITMQLSALAPKSVVDFVYLINFASGPFSLIQNGQVDGRHAVPYYVTVSDCSLTRGYVGVEPGVLFRWATSTARLLQTKFCGRYESQKRASAKPVPFA